MSLLKSAKQNNFKEIKIAVSTSAICFIMYMVIFAFMHFYPFGGRSLAWCDFEQQYIPLLLELKNIIEKGGSFFLGKGGGGMNIYGVFLFFVSSPLSLLSLIPDKTNIIYFVNILTVIKLSLSGFTASFFLSKMFSKLPTSLNIVLSLTYTFSGYAMMYYQDNMWLDIMYLFPILLLSIYRLVYSEKSALYIVALTLSMIMNFYISFMNAIFIILGFGVILWCSGLKNKGRICLKFIISSVAAAMLSAFIWIPSALQFTTSGRGGTASKAFVSGSIFENYQDKFALLSCTSIVIAGIIFMLVKRNLYSKPIPKSMAIMLVLIIAAAFIDPINKFWHTGSYQAFPFRYGFMAVFLGISVCAFAFSDTAENSDKKIKSSAKITAITAAIVLLYCCGVGLIYKSVGNGLRSYVMSLWVRGKDAWIALLLGVSACTVYLIIIGFYRKQQLSSRTATILIATVLSAEAFMNCKIYMGNARDVTQRYAQTIELADEINDNNFYRVKTMKRYFYSDMLEGMGFSSIAHYTSLTDGGFLHTAKALGYSSYWMDISTNGGTLVTDAFLMNKYMIGADSDMNSFYKKYNTDGIYKIYKNNVVLDGAVISKAAPYSLSGFKNSERLQASEFIAEKLLSSNDILEMQNDYSTENLSLTYKNGKYTAKIIDKSFPAYINYSFPVIGEKELYFDLFGNYSDNLSQPYFGAVNIYVNGKALDSSYPSKKSNGIIDCGTFADRYVSVKIKVNHSFEATSFGLGTIDTSKLSKAIKNSTTAPITLNDNKLYFTAGCDGWCYIPFVYNKGYSAEINGQKCKISNVMGSFMAVKVKSGDKLVLTFRPQGFIIGIVVSALGAGLCILLFALRKKKYTFPDTLEKTAAIAIKALWFVTFAALYFVSVVLWFWMKSN